MTDLFDFDHPRQPEAVPEAAPPADANQDKCLPKFSNDRGRLSFPCTSNYEYRPEYRRFVVAGDSIHHARYQ